MYTYVQSGIGNPQGIPVTMSVGLRGHLTVEAICLVFWTILSCAVGFFMHVVDFVVLISVLEVVHWLVTCVESIGDGYFRRTSACHPITVSHN